MATDEQIERVRRAIDHFGGGSLPTGEALTAVLSELATLRELLQRAVDDQRTVETMQGMVEWYDEAVEALAKCNGIVGD